MTSRTSIAPMAFRLRRAMLADVDLAAPPDRADQLVRVEIVGPAVGGGAADGVPVDRGAAVAVDRRVAAEIANA